VVVGQRVWDVQSKFRVRLGPIGYRQFCRFMPSGDALRPICQMIRSYAGVQHDFDVQPVLRAEEVPWCWLGDRGDPARLGWNTWVRSRTFEHDVDDAVFYLEG
jgi:type VI secretion system protein ImpH